MGVAERRARERAARRKQVLDAARALVRERGFYGTTTKEIAKACELSEATLFFYFESKDAIFTSLLLEGIEFTRLGIAEVAQGHIADASAADTLQHLWDFFSRLAQEHPEYFHTFAHLAHPRSTTPLPDKLKDELALRSGDNFRELATLLTHIGGGGDTRVIADLLWGAFVGLTLLRASRVNLGAPAHPTADDLKRACELLLHGINNSLEAPS